MSNEEQIIELLKQNREILGKPFQSAEKTRKYFLYSFILTIVMFFLPLIGLIIIIPIFLSTYMDAYKGLL